MPIMSRKSTTGSSYLLAVTLIFAGALAVWCRAQGQVLNQDQEILVHNLPALTAHSPDPSETLLASLEIVLHDKDVCCGTNSALRDNVLAADPKSLKDIAEKLAGRHLLSDGRPINVTAEYVAPDAINSGRLISTMVNQQAALIEWNFHFYVVYGVVYVWTASGDPASGSMSRTTAIHKLLLWDTRFSDSRRDVVFDRTTDDLSKAQGMLFLQTTPQ